MAAATIVPISRLAGGQLRLAPSLPDWFCALFLAARFGQLDAWQSLLGDGDTGWHIRTGEYILDHGVPMRDLFSFSRAGQPWYAWEWLSDLIFGQVHRWWGLAGVAAMSALLICLPAALLFAWLLRRQVGVWIGLAVTFASTSAASVHYLARPHLFSLVLLTAGLWLLEEDRREHTPWLWTLVPMTGLWANLHAGFVAWLAILGLLAAVGGVRRDFVSVQRYGILATLSAFATLINPYGWQLHWHIFKYLRSTWIAEHVQEFQSPQFRSENMVIFALLLFAGVAVAAKIWRAQLFEAAMILIWGFAALRSARYIPLFAVIAAPSIAAFAAERWKQVAARARSQSAWRILWESSQVLGERWGLTPWAAILVPLAMCAVLPVDGLANLPARFFPVMAVDRNSHLLTTSGQRVLTSDQWADYLIYRLYSGAPVFFDGRSDFYGEQIGNDYRTLQQAGRDSRAVLARYGFTAALLPLDWPLGQVLDHDPQWTVAYRDGQAVLFLRSRQ